MAKRFVLAVAVGALLLGRLAFDASAATTRVEAETFTLASSAGRPINDASASAGQSLLIWSNATASRQVTTEPLTNLIVRARGDQCSGAPKMVVALDGQNLITKSVKNTAWGDYSVSLSRPAGSHTIAVTFTNDLLTNRCDRNLWLDFVGFVSPDTGSPPPPPSSGTTLYVDPNGPAKQQADAWRSSRPADAAQMDKIAAQPQGFWFGDWSGDVRMAVDNVVTAANGKTPILVAYNIPQRDCGGYSGGGTVSPAAYRSWIQSFADGIGTRPAIVIIEPDALAYMDCLNEAEQSTRLNLLRDAATILNAKPNASVYIDAGHSRWLPASEAANRLNMAGVSGADGFSINVSNFGWTSSEVSYGNQVSSGIGGKHFVVDTGRNGLGPTADNQWCNPPGRALGDRPTLTTGQALADAYLWVKRPGESDGPCNGGPAAGAWWADYALGLAQRAAY